MSEHRTNINLTKDPDIIWGMVEGDGRIEIRFDSGDAGLISLTPQQARELRDDLSELLLAAIDFEQPKEGAN